MPTVSVVIPLYNDCRGIARAVRSALKQSSVEEIIVVDDCSTDDSLAVAEKLERDHPLVRVLRMDENSGPGAARNFGAKAAKGDFLAFLDSDDEYLDNYFSDMLAILAANSQMHAIKVGMEFVDPVKGYVLPAIDPRYVAVVFSSPCNVVIRRESFLKMGGFSDDPIFRKGYGGEDVAFCQALAKFLPPLGRNDKVYYRCWSRSGSHLDKFLATTRLANNQHGFEFVSLGVSQMQGGELEQAISRYMESVRIRLDFAG